MRWPCHVRDRHTAMITIYNWSTSVPARGRQIDTTGLPSRGNPLMPTSRIPTDRHDAGREPPGSRRRAESGRLDVEIEVPGGVTAKVDLPGAEPRRVGGGRHRFVGSTDVRSAGRRPPRRDP
jgi:hypothetical protein